MECPISNDPSMSGLRSQENIDIIPGYSETKRLGDAENWFWPLSEHIFWQTFKEKKHKKMGKSEKNGT